MRTQRYDACIVMATLLLDVTDSCFKKEKETACGRFYFNSLLESLTLRKAWCWEWLSAVDRSGQRKGTRVLSGLFSISSFIQSGIVTGRVGPMFPPQLNNSGDPLTDIPTGRYMFC